MPVRILVYILVCTIMYPFALQAQTGGIDTATANQLSPNSISEKSLSFIQKKYAGLTNAVDKQTIKLLERMQRRENKLRDKLAQKDSSKAKELFDGTASKYQQLQAKLQSPNPNGVNPLKEYIPGLDSTATAFKFLQQNSATVPGVDPEKLKQIQGINTQIQQLQGQMQQANEIQAFVRQREQLLKDHLSSYGLGKELAGINKDVFYFRQRLEGYKELINNKEKLEEAVIQKLTELPVFQEFMNKNSYAAQLFSLPANYGDPASLAGMQTRGQVAQMVSQRVGSTVVSGANGNPAQYFQPQIDGAQDQLSALKKLLSQFGGSSGTLVTPDFKPNPEKTKSLFRRLVYGINIQTQQASTVAPSMGNIALTLGYKLSDRSIIGIGANYMLGLGRGINHFRLSNEGAGVRSFIDLKLKGSFWVSGGYEATYMQAFQKFVDLYKVKAWEQSALFGLTNKIKLSKTRESNMQLLFDALYKQHAPQTQPIIFRFGYSFN